MCGIFAAFDVNGLGDSDALLRGAVEKVAHRGPDNAGHFSDGVCFLGHTRLSIIGIEKSGNQPFHFGDLAMVYNGEVFNYLELRQELLECGYSFDSASDTEVVLKAYHKWGEAAFNKLNGMWALVIYDRARKRLVASRDRFGQKPMFYLRKGGAVYIASEVQQLVPFSDRAIDFGLIQMFLKEGGYEGGGRTFFRGIHEFPKAHNCRLERSQWDLTRYWDYWNGEVKDVDDGTFADFDALLDDAVRIRLRSDVPFGLILSGGVDSTIVSAISREHVGPGAVLPAFNFSSQDRDDESVYAEEIARELNLSLSIHRQEREPGDYRERLKGLVQNMGRGHSSPAIVSVDYLYQAVSKAGIKVALDGQGADELLAGYKHYYPIVIPSFLFSGKFRQAYYLIKDQLRAGLGRTIMLYMRNVMPEALKRLGRRLYGYETLFRDYRGDDGAVAPPKTTRYGNKSALNRYLIWQHDTGLANLLFYGDIVSMRNSVENRSPFMDHRLVDFVLSHSDKLKVWNGLSKYALRRHSAYTRFKKSLDRRKIGFNSAIPKKTKGFMLNELAASPILEWPIFSPSLQGFLRSPKAALEKYERLVFRLYQVHLWNEVFYAKNNHD